MLSVDCLADTVLLSWYILFTTSISSWYSCSRILNAIWTHDKILSGLTAIQFHLRQRQPDGEGETGEGGSGSVVLSIWNEEDKSSSHEITAGVLINDKLIA